MSFWLETSPTVAAPPYRKRAPQKRIKLFYYTHENAIQFS